MFKVLVVMKKRPRESKQINVQSRPISVERSLDKQKWIKGLQRLKLRFCEKKTDNVLGKFAIVLQTSFLELVYRIKHFHSNQG